MPGLQYSPLCDTDSAAYQAYCAAYNGPDVFGSGGVLAVAGGDHPVGGSGGGCDSSEVCQSSAVLSQWCGGSAVVAGECEQCAEVLGKLEKKEFLCVGPAWYFTGGVAIRGFCGRAHFLSCPVSERKAGELLMIDGAPLPTNYSTRWHGTGTRLVRHGYGACSQRVDGVCTAHVLGDASCSLGGGEELKFDSGIGGEEGVAVGGVEVQKEERGRWWWKNQKNNLRRRRNRIRGAGVEVSSDEGLKLLAHAVPAGSVSGAFYGCDAQIQKELKESRAKRFIAENQVAAERAEKSLAVMRREVEDGTAECRYNVAAAVEKQRAAGGLLPFVPKKLTGWVSPYQRRDGFPSDSSVDSGGSISTTPDSVVEDIAALPVGEVFGGEHKQMMLRLALLSAESAVKLGKQKEERDAQEMKSARWRLGSENKARRAREDGLRRENGERIAVLEKKISEIRGLSGVKNYSHYDNDFE